MKIEINVPDNLPQDRLKKEIQDFEQRLQIEAQLDSINKNSLLNAKQSKAKAVAKLLAWTQEHQIRLEGGIPSREERNVR
ncbi:hypothetical protein ACN4EE_07590 [Geminocystis sp. CENA526]|uniref:hypothetical protein n=1 Tax=Geminocystis sp. CENA526 TaxID=1355871 RepID=UPI003D6E7899